MKAVSPISLPAFRMSSAGRLACLIIVAALFAGVVLAGCGDRNGGNDGGGPESENDGPVNADYINPASFSCVSNPAPQFTAFVTDLALVPFIVPLGTASGNEVKNRTYLHSGPGNRVPVYAPVDSVLTTGAYKIFPSGATDYRLDFTASCEITYTLDHIVEPIDKIRNVFPPTPSESSVSQQLSFYVIVSAGELIGYTTGTQQAGSWDFAVFDSLHENRFINQDRYRANLHSQLHAVCPYDLYPADMRDQYYALFADPGGTKVPGAGCRSASRDVADALSGQWFLDAGAGTYDRQVAIVKELTGDVRLALGTNPSGNSNMIIWTNHQTWADPEDPSVAEQCYSDDSRYAFFRVHPLDKNLMDVHIGSGACPATFPAAGFVNYSR